jgi:hypothetical protein
MSILFTPFTLGKIELKNRFVFSACEDNLADENGFITDAIIRKNQKIAKGQAAIVISSHMYVSRIATACPGRSPGWWNNRFPTGTCGYQCQGGDNRASSSWTFGKNGKNDPRGNRGNNTCFWNGGKKSV